jgi:hypothetical protein
MATYYKSVTVWNKESITAAPASVLEEIETKKTAMLEAGTMHEQQGYTDNDTTVSNLYRFTTRASADEWSAFIDGIATTNNLNKISSRIVEVNHAD